MKPRILKILLVVYGLVLLWVLFLRRVGLSYAWSWAEYVAAMHNFIPFRSLYELLSAPYLSARVVFRFGLNFIGNILLFVPWGILLPACFPKLRGLRRFVGLTLPALLVVEAVQVFAMLGSFDVEDLLLNLCGAGVGFAVFRKLRRSNI